MSRVISCFQQCVDISDCLLLQGSRKMPFQVNVIFFAKLLIRNWQNSTSFDEDACCDRKIKNVDDEECGCPNYNLFNVHGSYPGYREKSLEFPPGSCPGWDTARSAFHHPQAELYRPRPPVCPYKPYNFCEDMILNFFETIPLVFALKSIAILFNLWQKYLQGECLVQTQVNIHCIFVL